MPLNRPVSALPMALFRIGFGLVLAGEYLHLLYFRELLTPPGASPFWAWTLRAAALAGLPAALALSAGAFTRVAAAVSWLCAVAAFGFATRQLGCAYQADGFLVFGALLSLLCPMERALSWDHRRRGSAPMSSLHGVLVAVMLAASYLDAFTWKIGTAPWRAGLGLWMATSQPFATWFDLTWLSSSPLIVPLGYLVLAFQASFAVLIWFRRLRPLLALFGVSMHLLIGLLFPIPFFGLVVALFYFPLALARERPASGPPPAARAARIAILAWLFLWPLIGVQALLPRQSSLARASQRLQRVTCALVGLCRRPIFLPGPFHDHVPEYRIAFASSQGTREIPLTSVEGTMQRYGFNRNWNLYSLYVHQPTLAETIPGLQRFCRFWAARHQAGPGELVIEQRTPNVDFGAFDPGRLATNRNRPWTAAARVPCDQP